MSYASHNLDLTQPGFAYFKVINAPVGSGN